MPRPASVPGIKRWQAETKSPRGWVTSVTYSPDGQFEFLAVGETTTDTFDYTISDGNGGTDSATVTVTITGENDAPTKQ